MYLSVRDHIFGTTCPLFTKFFMHVTYGSGSVLLWRRKWHVMYFWFYGWRHLLISQGCSTSPPSLSAVHMHLWLGYKLCAVILVTGQRTHGTTFRALKVTSQVATPGAESAVRDCLVPCACVAFHRLQSLSVTCMNFLERTYWLDWKLFKAGLKWLFLSKHTCIERFWKTS